MNTNSNRKNVKTLNFVEALNNAQNSQELQQAQDYAFAMVGALKEQESALKSEISNNLQSNGDRKAAQRLRDAVANYHRLLADTSPKGDDAMFDRVLALSNAKDEINAAKEMKNLNAAAIEEKQRKLANIQELIKAFPDQSDVDVQVQFISDEEPSEDAA